MKNIGIKLILEIPEAKTKEELRRLTRSLLYAGSTAGLINYKIRNFKIGEIKNGDIKC